MKEITGRFESTRIYITPSNRLIGRTTIGDFPRIYQAQSIEDFKQGREEQLEELLNRGTPRLLSRFPDPSLSSDGASYRDLIAICFLPSVDHFPAFDPQGRRGIFKRKTPDMYVKDLTGDMVVKPDKASWINFPFTTSFHKRKFDAPYWDQSKWDAYREISWHYPVIVMARFAERMHKFGENLHERQNITDIYWLLHIYGQIMATQRAAEGVNVNTVPVLNPVLV